MPSVARKARPQDDKLQTSLAARAAAPADESRWHAVVPDVRLSRNDKGIAEKEPSLPQNVDPLKDIDLYRSPTPYGVERPLEELPEPKKAVGLVRRGIDWPLVPGSNYLSLPVTACIRSFRRRPIRGCSRLSRRWAGTGAASS